MDSTSSSENIPDVTSTGATPAITPVDTKEVRLVDIPVTDATMALNIMASFLNVAHRRGAFSLDESAKIWECLKRLTVPSPN
jgi:hypothetical protein